MMQIRSLEAGDRTALTDFFARIPAQDTIFFKEDIADPDVIERWVKDTRGRRLIAVDDAGTLVGMVGVVPGLGSADHVGEVRLVIDPAARGAGLGRALAQRILLEALELELKIIYVEVIARQEALVVMFQSLGFQAEALLTDFVRDRHGDFHDLMLLTHRVDDEWSGMATVGLDEALR